MKFKNEFDVVLNLADGAIGYLEKDMENLKIFDVISNALKPGGKHFMDICNAKHAEHCFPKSAWETGETSIALSTFEWDPEKRIMLYGGWDFHTENPHVDLKSSMGTQPAFTRWMKLNHSCRKKYDRP